MNETNDEQDPTPPKVLQFLALVAFVIVSIFYLTGCASTIRLPGQRDPMVEVVRILADAIKDQKPTPTPTATPSPTPEGDR